MTSHSSQGQTADRVLVHVETERASEPLVNRRLAYVAVSRGRFDAQIYTDDKAQLGDALSREVRIDPRSSRAARRDISAQALEPSSGGRQEAPLVIAR